MPTNNLVRIAHAGGFTNPALNLNLVPDLAGAHQNALATQRGRMENQIVGQQIADYPADRNYLMQQRANADQERQHDLGQRSILENRAGFLFMGKALQTLPTAESYFSQRDNLMQKGGVPEVYLRTRQEFEEEAAKTGKGIQEVYDKYRNMFMGQGAEKPAALSDIGKYLSEMEKHPEGSPARKFYESKLKSMTENGQKPVELSSPEKLRGEFIKGSGDFIKIRDSYNRISVGAQDPSAAGDVALIFNYMKMLDPGSVVRESEYATAANAAGVPEKTRALWNRVVTGERLSQATREDFFNTATKLYKKQLQSHNKLVSQYTALAERAGANPQDVIVDYELAEDIPSGENQKELQQPEDQQKSAIQKRGDELEKQGLSKEEITNILLREFSF